MGSTEELIVELARAAGRHQHAAIAFLLPDSTAMMIWPNYNAQLERLSTVSVPGGVPFGLIAVDHVDGRATVTSLVCPEHDDWAEADECMDRLVEEFLYQIESSREENEATVQSAHLSAVVSQPRPAPREDTLRYQVANAIDPGTSRGQKAPQRERRIAGRR